MSKSIEVVRNYEDEMIWVYIDEELHTSGNFWDLDADSWIGIMEAAGLDVTETTEEGADEEESDDE